MEEGIRICALGGGSAVGVAYLVLEGHSVPLAEACEVLGLETSLANRAQISYSYVAPPGDPSVLPKLAGWLLNPGSPLRIVPRLDSQHRRRRLALLRACSRDVGSTVTAQLLGLGYRSRTLVHELVEPEELVFNYQGKLVLYGDPEASADTRRQLEYQARLGRSQQAVDGAGLHRPPGLSTTNLHYKVVYARLGERLRIAGMVDLVGWHPRANQKRIVLLARQARETFPDGADCAAAAAWCGSRPATPDSKPLIGATPYDNLWLNTGHGALGFTLACGGAALLADAIARRPSALDASAFALAR